jgi:hypothetical protein
MTDIFSSEKSVQTALRQETGIQLSFSSKNPAETRMDKVIGQGLTDATATDQDYAAQTDYDLRAARRSGPQLQYPTSN